MRRERSKKLRVLLTRTLQDFAIKELQKHYKIEIHSGPFPMPKRKLLLKIKEQDGLICFPYDNIDKEVIQAGTKLKTISAFSVGYDQIDSKYAKKRKIKIGYTPNVLTVATADRSSSLLTSKIIVSATFPAAQAETMSLIGIPASASATDAASRAAHLVPPSA